ncbi:formylglycine-generating enzyme family protein [Pseudomonas yamanorum]|jgi:formylglycine-generating enzyme required for sulfatase activity|uniref:Formylglycine-generating enzyme family protein n=1 Tax=Pseudomonas yamanorum TaxID=515393 RepID=A0AAJ3H706_9PSED|nr:formylglycine-generating enzyme family protein [Pseudomonas yamanorum]AMW82599.1 PvdO, pyoverdine responsive serine/threonine kinase [Pseudomonas yamanorum]MDR0190465.1 formylglycine-generating enzyme family protein [Pseudomonas yamanorum]NWD44778.1 formylglycine-generating enzyme family protein [Pseudomonas yamanorum]
MPTLRVYLPAAILSCLLPLAAQAASPPAPGSTFKDCKDCPEMVVLPAGSFTMGTPEGEVGREPDEGPLHTVTFARPLAMGRFQILASEWETYVRQSGNRTPDGDANDGSDCKAGKPGYPQGARQPAVCMGWDDVQQYVAWLSKKTGKHYRLQSEAEREYGARAGSTGPFPFPFDAEGQYSIAKHANTYGPADGFTYTSPAGSFPANAFGLYDMHGNVWEWTQDCFNDSYNGAPADGSAWMTGDCEVHQIRGNDWSSAPVFSRSGNRNHTIPNDRQNWLGFRVVREL